MTTLSGVDTLTRLLALRCALDDRDGLRTATMVSGYPGSPLGTFDLALDKADLEKSCVVHRPGLNEELAAAVVWGSQMGAVLDYADLDGVVGAWYGKGPGLDRSGDALKHGNAMGAGPNGGAVVFCGDDPGAKSSTLPCDSQYTFEDAGIPVLVPADQQDVLDLGVHAFRMSRFSGAWVGLKIVTAVADGVGPVDPDPDRLHPREPLLVAGRPWKHEPASRVGPHAVPGQEALMIEHRLVAAAAYARSNGLDQVTGEGRVGIVCAGATYHVVKQALGDAPARILKLGLTYPLVPETVREFAASVDEIVVIEEKRPFVETQLRALLHEAGDRTPVRGKRDASGAVLVPTAGELDVDAVAAILSRVVAVPVPVLAPVRRSLPLLNLPGRPPGFCSGCPHNRSTVVPDGALVGGGVGCHGIVYFETRHAHDKALPPTPMGAEGVPWIGLSPFVDEPHVIQNLGDGTLTHSGSLAIRASVAAGVNVTFKILYNAAVAMTGGQDVTGLLDVPSLTRSLEAEGVKRIVVCAEDPRRYPRRARWAPGVQVLGRDELNRIQEELRSVPGVTVIVYDQRCAAEARRLRKRGELPTPPRKVVINQAVCEGCGDCSVKSNCLSVVPHATEFGEKRHVHDPSCNRDYTCLEGDCPSFVTLTPRKRRRTQKPPAGEQRPGPTLPAGRLPVPSVAASARYGVYITGIGGTGVITAGRIVAGAAEAAGLTVSGLDQTGLSQKAGAVVSHLQLGAVGAPTVGAGDADLYLSGDILQAAGPRHLVKVTPGRTIAVIDEHLEPTAPMLQGVPRPSVDDLKASIVEAIGADRVLFLDPRDIAETVFSDHLLANVILVGAAFQRGALPVSLPDVETALASFGEANRTAFAWGRWAAHDPAAVAAALAGHRQGGVLEGTVDPSAKALRQAAELAGPDRTLIRRTAQVIDYQDVRLARRYLGLVRRVARTDPDGRLTAAVAESWFKVLTYKDEYEVARLHLAASFPADVKVTYHLHPPTLRRLGLSHKLPMAGPYRLGFHVLRRMKRLRGTVFDPFGLDPDRRTERSLIREYEALILGSAELPYERRVELAESVQSVKGYGPIKDRAVAEWRASISS